MTVLEPGVRADGVVDQVARLEFAAVDRPQVSIVIPVFNQIAATARCLLALHAHTPLDRVEVVVADDGSSDATPKVLASIAGVRPVRLAENGGFQGAMTAGVAAARGEFIHMLNNDTEVEEGWLEPLLALMEEDPTVGAVGSKLVFPNGDLQEAGSVVWSDGTPWNLGRGGNASAPQFNVVRPVDYCSAASLLVRRSVYDQVGGFDTLFAPAYFEDVDLCFKLWEAGFRVLYQPLSVVRHQASLSHHDPLSDSTPAGRRSKGSMVLNRHLFAAKWANELEHHWPNQVAEGQRGGRITHRPHVLLCLPSLADSDVGSETLKLAMARLAPAGCRITVFPADGEAPDPISTRLQQSGVEVYRRPWDMDELVASHPGVFDLVVLAGERVAAGLFQQVRRAYPAARVVGVEVAVAESDPSSAVDPSDAARRRQASALRACDHMALLRGPKDSPVPSLSAVIDRFLSAASSL